MWMFTRSMLCLSALAGLASVAFAGPFAFTTIEDPLAASGTYVTGINDSGQIVGYYSDATGKHGFLYSGGVFTPIDDPLSYCGPIAGCSNSTTQANGINNAGEIVGSYENWPYTTGFLDSGGTFNNISDPNGASQSGFTASGINDSGQIVGVDYVDGGFLYSGGSFTYIADPLATNGTAPLGINDSGQIVGSYYGFEASGDGGNCCTNGFLYSDGVFTTITDGGATSLTGINNEGQIVGTYNDGVQNHGLLYSGGVFTAIDDPSAASGTTVTGINDEGQIVGYYIDASGGIDGFLATPTASSSPEPATLITMLAALLGMAGYRTRKAVMRS